jgi:hypothetical protein
MRVRAGVRTIATAATIDVAAAVLWNPHATIRLRVYEVSWFKTVATADFLSVCRITARGTQTTSVTPGIANETDRAAAPASGAVIDTAWSAQPTKEGTTIPLFRISLPAAVGAGFMLPLGEELEVPPGAGLGFLTPVATILQPADLNFAWAE